MKISSLQILFLFIASFAGSPKTLSGEERVFDSEKIKAVWQTSLEPLMKLSGAELYRQSEKLDLRVIDLTETPAATEKADFDFFEDYFSFTKAREIKLKNRAYTALYVSANVDLPKPYSPRPLLEKSILIVDADSTRESYFHLLLHHLDRERKKLIETELTTLTRALIDAKKEADKNGAEIQRLTQEILKKEVKRFEEDTEVLKDLYLMEKAEDFKMSSADLGILDLRVKRNIDRLKRDLRFLADNESVEETTKKGLQNKITQLEEEFKKLKK